MKKNILCVSAVIVSVFATVSCGHDHDVDIPIKGSVTISQNIVSNGDTVFLSINEIPQNLYAYDANGEIYVKNEHTVSMSMSTYLCGSCSFSAIYSSEPKVCYYIDGILIGESQNWDGYFNYRYIVPNLEDGVHTLSATASPITEVKDLGINFTGKYTSSEFWVKGNKKN